jgi:hypothetical protein
MALKNLGMFNQIMKIKGDKSTVSSVILKIHKGPRCNGDSLEQLAEVMVTGNQ